jgi:hypothetical protein
LREKVAAKRSDEGLSTGTRAASGVRLLTTNLTKNTNAFVTFVWFVVEIRLRLRRDPSSVAFGDTFSRKGRRNAVAE